jgi:two-component system, sensor histidine kinase and response regulator
MEIEIKSSSILIVDDKDSNIELLTELLETNNYLNVHTINDSRKVMEMVDTLQPDLILLDLMMPYISGFDILELLKRNPEKYGEIRILVLTADISLATKQRALSLGAHDFLTKPFDLVETNLRIKNLLFGSYLYKQLQNQNQLLEEKVASRTADLQKSNEAIQEQNQALREIAWMQSHVVRAPVARILGLSHMLEEPDLTEDLKNKTILAIIASVRELDEAVKEITQKTYFPGMEDF